MPNYNHTVINTVQNKVVNTIVWDGVTEWQPPVDCIVIEGVGDFEVGDDVSLVDGVWSKVFQP